MSDDEIFCAAIELPSRSGQRELVESLCSNDEEQFRRVWGLLETHYRMAASRKDSRSILDRAGEVFHAFSGTTELIPGTRIGQYVLQELIGEGATSFVFKARELTQIGNEVALKILKPGMDSHRILARFGLEHQVLQRLQHSGITSVFDVGVHENCRPYFAMELVPDAKTIVRYAEQFSLDRRSRILLMISTCEIVQHAHQRGVIHRDLKPSNILVEGVALEHPRPRIIDFGIAKILQGGDESAGVTTMGERFGTPAYMSPEQALRPAGGVDIRSDVYSLGVVLYELLTGLTPRDASRDAGNELPWTSEAYWSYGVLSPSEVRSPRPEPSRDKTQRGSSRELDLITLKAIAKDQNDRYQTVADLQRDLQRFLNGDPIEAAGPRLFYRAGKVVQRNPALSAAVIVTLLTIVLTSVLTTSFAYRAHEAEKQVRLRLDETLAAQKDLRIERDRAENAMKRSQSLLRVFQVQTVTDRALSRFVKIKLEAAMRGQGPTSESSLPLPIQIEVLTRPHSRLIVQGDWHWASDRFPADIINTSFQINSRQAAQALPDYSDKSAGGSGVGLTTVATGGDVPVQSPSLPSAQELASDRESLQELLLEELKAVLPVNDPFIAETLDNCGLQALDNNRPDEAERFLTESVRIWSTTGDFPANVAQSQLFLAEALSRLDDHDRSVAMLNHARKTLENVPRSDAHFAALGDLLRQLELSVSAKD